MSQKEERDRRNFVRLNPPLLAKYRILEESSIKTGPQGIQSAAPGSEKEIVSLLREINDKFNKLITLLDLKKNPSYMDIECKIINFSGNGIRILSNQKLRLGTTLDMNLEVPPYHYYVMVVGQVIWCKTLTKEKNCYEIGIEFIEIDPDDQEVVIKYIFSEQRKLCKRKKEV